MAALLFKKAPVFILFGALLAMSVLYVTRTGQFLLDHQTDQRRNHSAGHEGTPLPRPSITIEKQRDPPRTSNVRSASTPPHQNYTEGLEQILRFFPLEEVPKQGPRRNPHKRQNPAPDQQQLSLAALIPRDVAMNDGDSTTTLPPQPLSHLIDEETWQVKAPVHDQLDFAIIAHAKTGTTFLQSTWWAAHDEIRMPRKECRLMPQEGGPAKVVQLMHTLRNETASSSSSSSHVIYGYKNPQDINRPRALVHFRDYFPKTKLIVGLRHPVWWFQSFYNYRIKRGGTLPPAESLVGVCTAESLDVCTDNGNFHANLASLGLTNRSSARERELLSTKVQLRRALRPPLPNPIFLYEQSQLDAGRDAEAAEALRQDLSAFLGLHRTPLPPLTRSYEPPDHATFSICDARYAALRRELVRIGEAAAHWILEFFLPLPTVYASSKNPGDLERLLLKWGTDPCVESAA